jgi:hypothetical protein
VNLSPLRSTISRLSSPLSRGTSGGLDQSLLPYVPKVIEAERQKQGQFQPLQMVLDLLQRGQYLTANIADEIEKSARDGTPLGNATLNTLKAAFQGLTGQRKGDWETLLFGGNIVGGGERAGWLPESMKGESMSDPLIRWGGEGSTGLAEGIFRPRKLIGLAANVAGDPLTYLSFGATNAAKSAASKYAQDVVKLTIATMGEKEVGKLGLKFSDLVGKNAENVMKVVQKDKGNAIGRRFLEDTYNQAYMNALRNPAKQITEDIAPKLQEAISRETPNSGLESLINSISQGIGGGYEKAGQRSFNFLGKPISEGIRQPWAPQKSFETIARRFENTPAGKGLGDAWYSVMNNGVVGQLRKSIGIRNPYEQMLNLTKRRISDLGIEASSSHHSQMIHQVFKNYDQETQDLARDAVVAAESIANKEGAYTALSGAGYEGKAARWSPTERQALVSEYDVLNKLHDPAFKATINLTPDKVENVTRLLEEKAKIDKYFTSTENEIAQRVTGSPVVDDRINYFPQLSVGKGEMGGNTIGQGGIVSGAGTSGFTKGKAMTVEDRIQNNANMLKFLMGKQLKEAWEVSGSKGTLDDFVNKFIVDHNLSETTLDLEGAYQLRAIAHSHFMAKYNMIEEFRQFGIPIQDAIKAHPGIEGSLMTFGEGTSNLGLYKVNVPGFENMLFDKPVSEVITNAGKLLGSDESSKGIISMFDKFTNLWKGYAVATPGFTFRNVIQNNLTGFMKFGPAWLDPRKWQESIVGTAYAMNPEKYVDILRNEFKIPESGIAMLLNKRIGDGDFTLKELVDWAKQNGTIATRSQAAQEGIATGAASFNPASKNFALFKGARAVNDFAENQAKLQSFLLDYGQMSKGAQDMAKPMAERLATQKQYLEYADAQTKKWFIDYGDLTPFEQKIMKRIIPFWSWVRHNMANQLTGLVTLPETYSLIPKVRNALTDKEGNFNPSLLPDYMKNVGYYPVGKTPQGTNIMRWANIALEDVNKIPVTFQGGKLTGMTFTGPEIIQDVFSAAHPLLKSVVEMITNKDTFHRREIRQFERAAPVFQYLNNAPKVVQFLDGAMRMAGNNEGIRIKVGTGGKEVQIDGKVERLLDTNIPALRTLDMLISTPEVMAEQLSPAVESWVERTFGKKDYYTGLEELFQVISRVGGWKFKEVNQDEQAKLKESELRAALSKEKSNAEQNTAKDLANATKMAKSRKATESRNRRYFGSYTR